jgi:hypothetical protein
MYSNRAYLGALRREQQLPASHEREHELIAEAIAEDWIADRRLLVHLARQHGLEVQDVANDGLTPLIAMHDSAHGRRCFEDAELKSPSNGLRRGVKRVRGEE